MKFQLCCSGVYEVEGLSSLFGCGYKFVKEDSGAVKVVGYKGV